MRTLLITGSMPPLKCGIGYYSNRLLDVLNQDFDLLTTSGLNSHSRARRTYFIDDWKIRRLGRLIKICRGNYDIIHLQYPAKGYGRQLGINKLPYLIRLFTKSKLIVTLHEYHGSGLLGKARDFITSAPAHRVVVSNTYDQRALPWFIRRKSVIIPIGSNILDAKPNHSFFDKVIKGAGFSRTDPVLVFFGFAFANKGLETLIEAMVKLKAQLLMLCELNDVDPYQASLMIKITDATNEGARIHVTGFLDDKQVSEILQECDAFVLPQPLPLTAKSGTAIAAVVNGLPVISTAADNPDLNLPYVNGVNSVLLPSMNSEALAEAIDNLPNKASYAEELSNLKDYFSWQHIADEHSKLYEEIAK